MDAATSEVMMRQFVAMVDLADLRCDEPAQFSKSWDNNGKWGESKIIDVNFIDEPCAIRFSLFFDGKELLKTGIIIQFKNETIINDIHKGDVLGYMQNQRIDPIGFLKTTYGTAGAAAAMGPGEDGGGGGADAILLAVNEDSEDLLMRAVEQLTGRTAEDLQTIWRGHLAKNSQRMGKDQASPFIKIWLRKERNRLDMEFLEEAQLLEPREGEDVSFQYMKKNRVRTYRVVTTRLSGAAIKEKILQVQSEWWGGAFYGLQNGRLARLPHEDNELQRAMRGLNSNAHFDVEDIFVEGRHVYSVG